MCSSMNVTIYSHVWSVSDASNVLIKCVLRVALCGLLVLLRLLKDWDISLSFCVLVRLSNECLNSQSLYLLKDMHLSPMGSSVILMVVWLMRSHLPREM